MIILADNDIILKLARCDLFTEFLKAFAVKGSDVGIFKQARFSIKSRCGKKGVKEGELSRLNLFLDQVIDLSISPSQKYIAALTEQIDKNIHAGEAALFASCPLIEESVIVTGDKNCLTGLAEAGVADTVCKELCGLLQGKIFCFEQVLLRILDNSGFAAVQERLILGSDCDGGLSLWLGSQRDANEAQFRAGLDSYLADARLKTGSLLSV